MSKFSVGDKAVYIGPAIYGLSECHVGMVVTIEAIGGSTCLPWVAAGIAAKFPGHQAYKVRWPDDGMAGLVPEMYLKPLPGDSIPAITRELFTKKQRNPDDVPVKERA